MAACGTYWIFRSDLSKGVQLVGALIFCSFVGSKERERETALVWETTCLFIPISLSLHLTGAFALSFLETVIFLDRFRPFKSLRRMEILHMCPC